MPNYDLTGQVAIITGGGSGIGRAVALRFAREGCRVTVADINTDNAAAVAGK
ncbi:MAG: SDR family NAD(P)-dependent oxidoreductase [Caldilineaceae bacterium]